MEGGFVPQSSHGIMDEEEREEEEDDVGSLLDFSNGDEDEGSCNSLGSSSSSSEFMEDATSSSSSSSSNGPLFEMTSLISQLPFKRGLSKHFEGKSQSFTSLSNVKSLEDLIKPERPFKKKQLKSSKSYGWGLDKSLSPKGSITKKSSKISPFPSLKRHSFLSPQRSSGRSLETMS